MANHVRRQLREAVTTALTGLTTSGANVFPSRVYPLISSQLPGLRIYTNDEAIEPAIMAAITGYERRIEVVIECCARADIDLDDVLDEMQMEVEIALAQNVTVGSTEVRLLYTGVVIDLNADAEQEQGVARMTYDATIFTAANAPDSPL